MTMATKRYLIIDIILSMTIQFNHIQPHGIFQQLVSHSANYILIGHMRCAFSMALSLQKAFKCVAPVVSMNTNYYILQRLITI